MRERHRRSLLTSVCKQCDQDLNRAVTSKRSCESDSQNALFLSFICYRRLGKPDPGLHDLTQPPGLVPLYELLLVGWKVRVAKTRNVADRKGQGVIILCSHNYYDNIAHGTWEDRRRHLRPLFGVGSGRCGDATFTDNSWPTARWWWKW